MIKRFSFPSTFEIALLLSLIVFLFALVLTKPEGLPHLSYGYSVLGFWKSGFWDLLEFTMQMVLILVLGHTLALSAPIDKGLRKISALIKNNTHAVLLTGTMAMAGGYLNWGFGLVLGAILARKIGEFAQENNIQINYYLVGASGYLGMLVWHGGLSGSATLKVAEQGHFLQESMGVIPINQTVFSAFNLYVNLFLIILLLIVLYLLSLKKFDKNQVSLGKSGSSTHSKSKEKIGWILGLVMILVICGELFFSGDQIWASVDLNFVNFTLLALGLLFYGSLSDYVQSLSFAVKGATDIIIQFPFYAGILGMMKYSGLLVLLADDMVARSGTATFPLLSFASAAIVNFFVPSGGGQWAIQGPVMMEAAQKMGIDLPKMVMTFAYGDQLSNMLQPFWALPLLSITGIPAKEIFKYTAYFFLAATVVFGLSILIWLA
ncbi:TIGR00366 family protein [Cecembia sp.]|uniref:TIGR00366 family protein n=1 Tax=Cecembia sp. TaxID=1898110 RepID=UPI0025C0815F|nr:TIGR00366 family protein [Cecembia sp.]